MGPYDLPPRFDSQKPAEIRIERQVNWNRDLLLVAKTEAASSPNIMNRPQMTNHGQIKGMKLPEGWVEGPAEKYTSIGTRSFRWFHPPQDEKTKICFFYRGLGMNPASADSFRNIIRKPSHKLTPEEIQSLSELLRDMSDPKDFQMTTASTIDLNGKRVLLVEGRYIALQLDTHEIFIDSDGTGRFVQEVYYKAPKDLYPKSLPKADVAFKSIIWK